MNSTLENIDKLRERANISYKEAKEILEKTNGDLVEALIYLEEKETKFVDKFNKTGETILKELKDIIKSGNVTKVVLKKDNKIIMNIPVTAGVIGAVLAPTLAALGVGAALLTECTIEISKQNGEIVNLKQYTDEAVEFSKELSNEAIDKLKNIANNSTDSVSSLKDNVTNIANNASDNVTNLTENVKNKSKQITDDIVELRDDVKQKLNDKMNELKD